MASSGKLCRFLGTAAHDYSSRWVQSGCSITAFAELQRGRTLHAWLAAGWFALWHTTMKDVGFFREIMGLNK